MAVTEIDYPVKGSAGSFRNIFPASKALTFQLNRQDISISAITSGTDNRVRIQASGNFENISVGDFVTWQSDGYENRSNRVTAVISPSTIEVDTPFVNTNASNGWVNYRKNYFLEVRYVQPNSSTDDQDALLILDDFSRIASDRFGDIYASLNVPSDNLIPDFELQTYEASNLSVHFKVQYRESWEGDRNQNWESPSDDISILLVHASVDIVENEFTDLDITKRYVRGYPLIYSFIYSSVNDNGTNNLSVTISELSINGEEITSYQVGTFPNLNGVAIIALDTSTFDQDTTFVQFSSSVSSNNGQYDPAQFDPAQYA